MPQHRTIELPEDLCATADRWLHGRFDNLEAMLRVVLEQIVKNDSRDFDESEEQLLEQRLRDLGYL
jgi:hypothetical protein